MKRTTSMAISVLLGSLPAESAVKLPPIFSDHMMLQAPDARVWGIADPGEEVTISFRETSVKTVASADGKWSATLTGLQPGTEGEMVVEGKNRLVIKNALVGEVWLTAGQSNMAFTMKATPDLSQHQSTPLSGIRMFLVAKQGSRTPKLETRGRWVTCTPETIGIWSAVGYFFAKDLHAAQKSPIGIINASVGNTQANAWTSREALENEPLLRKTYLLPWEEQMKSYPTDMAVYQEALAKWTEVKVQAESSGQRIPAPPPLPPGPDSHRAPAALYNAMIHGIAPYTIKGTLWYQGESDVQTPKIYRQLLPAMIASWRHGAGNTVPFFIVQLPNFQPRNPLTGRFLWAEMREVQQDIAESIPAAAFCTTIDIGTSHEIHPPEKQELGRRLSLLAQAKVYGREIIHTGPEFERVEFKMGEAIIRFKKKTANGLTTSNAESVKGFTISGKDRKFYPATARISVGSEGAAIIKVRANQVTSPEAVRYAWEDDPAVNLVNKEGLPAHPFRSDRW